MSGSDPARARLRLSSESGLAELAVIDSWFRAVEEGTGELDCQLEPGIYEIVARAGPSIERRLIKLVGGEDRPEIAPEVRFPATPPIRGSLAEDDRQLALVHAATGSLAGAADGAGLCVFVRDLAGRPMASDRQSIELFDGAMRPVESFGSGWRADGAAATWAGALDPGGYTLRLGRGPGAIDQSIWLSAGWTVAAFLAADDGVVSPTSVSIHLVPIGQEWTGGADAAATELALWGLREGRWSAGDVARALDRIKDVKSQPMLQLAAAHLLLASPQVPRELVAHIVGGLAATLAGHPDVAALQVLLEELGIQGAAPALPVSWPPMLAPSYVALLRRDARAADALKAGSLAERAAATIRRSGIWTTWQAVPAADLVPPRLARATVTSERVLARVARDPERVRRSKLEDPAARRVAAYLAAVGDLDEDGKRPRVATLPRAEIALATGLPAATVDRSLRRIWLAYGAIPLLPWIGALVILAVAVVGFGLFAFGPGPLPTPTPTAAPTAPVLLPRVDIATSLDLGDSHVREVTRRELPISNVGDAPLTILDIVTAGDAASEFAVPDSSCVGLTIPPGQGCTLLVTFTPARAGLREAALGLQTAEIGEVIVSLTGTAIPWELLLDPPEVRAMDLGEERRVFVGARGPVRIDKVGLAGADPTAFVLDASNCDGALLDSGTGCILRVIYKPGGEGAHAAEIVLEIDDGRRVSIPVDGIQVIF